MCGLCVYVLIISNLLGDYIYDWQVQMIGKHSKYQIICDGKNVLRNDIVIYSLQPS